MTPLGPPGQAAIRVGPSAGQPSSAVAKDQDGTVSVGDAVLADGTQEHPGELTVPSAADDQQGRILRCFSEDRGGVSLDDTTAHRQVGHSD